MRDFQPTMPVIPRRTAGPLPITAEEGDALIRASWPPRRAAEPDIDYRVHTSEVSFVEFYADDERPPLGLAGTLFWIVALAGSCALIGWVLVLGMRAAGMLP
jgi:hypothetical protein